MQNIEWLKDIEQAKEKSSHERKPILLQFERDQCSGCKKLEAITYLDEKVVEELQQWFIPLRLDILSNRKIRSQFSAIWTPSFFIMDRREKLYFTHDGYLNIEDFRVFLRIAFVHYLLPRGKYKDAIEIINKSLALFPKNPNNSKLLFLRGKAEYLNGWNKAAFRKTMSEIVEQYPESPEARTWPWMD